MPSGQQAGGGGSNRPAISGDGDAITFASDKTNLVTDDTNAAGDTFTRLRSASTTERDSVASDQELRAFNLKKDGIDFR